MARTNRKERRRLAKRGRSLTSAAIMFARQVRAQSTALKSLDPERSRADKKKIFNREAKRLVKKNIVQVPIIMREHGINY